MGDNKIAPAATGASKSTDQCKLRSYPNSPPKKIHRIITAFARGESLNFIEAQQIYHDRSLHSTVSEIQRDYQITVSRKTEVVPGFMGLPTHCRRYWLESSQQAKALKFLGLVT